jgi:subtilase family serine protease
MIRRLSTSLLTVVALVSAMNIASRAESKPLLTHHVRQVTLNGIAPSVGRLPASQSMRLVLVLPLRNREGLDNFLKDVYDPFSSNYRHFLTVEQFTEKFGPTRKDYDTVIRFAEANGFKVVGTSRNRLNIDVTGKVSNIEAAFHVTMGVYQHPTESRTFFAPDREPTLNLPFQLWRIAGLDNYSIPRPALARRDEYPEAKPPATTGSCPQASFCGSDMRAAYYGGTTLTGTGQYVGLLEYVGTDLADLTTYYTNAHQTLTVPITLVSTDGTPTTCLARQGCDDTEQTIDMTQALGMAPGLAGLTEFIGSTDSAIFNGMATSNPLMANLSSSWYWSPADPTVDDPYFEQFAAQGQNLFDAAGDGQDWQRSGSIWPSDDEYIVSVGGTDLDTSSAGGPWKSETAWVDGGGGISPNNIPIPAWQVTTAEGCVALGKDPCSTTLRNGPDVSANSNFTFYVCADQTTCSANLYGGTSFAAPMWAGYLALANEQLITNGGTTTLGFINPALYAIGLSSSYDTDFHDITSGSNGYSATTGYDLATGWGSPNGANLINALAVVNTGSFTISASPKGISIARGSSGTVTITSAISGGFDAAVTLSSASNVTFSPNPIPAPGSGTSTMTITEGRNAPLGKHTVKITGTGGGVTGTTKIEVNVIQ